MSNNFDDEFAADFPETAKLARELPPDLQASVDAAIASMKREELAFAEKFAEIWEEGFLKGQEGGHQQDDNPYLKAAQQIRDEIEKGEP